MLRIPSYLWRRFLAADQNWKLDICPFFEQAKMPLNVTLKHNTTEFWLVSTSDVSIVRSCGTGKGISFWSSLNMKYFHIFKITFILQVLAITSRSELSRNNLGFFKHWLWCEFAIDCCFFLNNVHAYVRYYINPSHETFVISFQMLDP